MNPSDFSRGEAPAARQAGIEALQVQILYGNSYAMLLANALNGALVTFLLRDQAGPRADLWFAAILAICLVRFGLVQAYRRQIPVSAAARLWGRFFTLGSAASGLAWGIGCLLLFTPGDIVSQLVIAFVVAGMAAGGVAGLHAWLPAALGFITPSLLGMLVTLIIQGELHYLIMAAMTVVMWVALTMISVNFNRMTRRSLALKVENLELTRKLDRAAVADAVHQAKAHFFAAMSHELRTPLNAILGFSELIRERTDGPVGSDKYETYIEDIHSSAGHLLELVNEALELSKIEADAIELDDSPVLVAEAVRAVVRLVQEEVAGGGIAIGTHFSNAETVLKADDRVFRQLLLILLSKTVKLATRGQKITVSTAIEQDGRLALRLAGLDLDPEEARRLMADFDQLDSTLANRQQAAGFGLGVARPLIELHGGTLEMQNQRGRGIVVTAYFPTDRLIAA